MLPTLVGGKKAQFKFTSTHFTIVLAVLFIVVSVVFYHVLQHDLDGFSDDWIECYRPAAMAMLEGRSPYSATEYPVANPPWLYLLLAPIALLPPKIGASIIFTLYLFSMGYCAYRLGAKPLSLAGFLLSFFVITGAVKGQIDFLPALGLFLPVQIGVFLVLAKPQVGIAVALFWAVEAYRSGGLQQTVRIFAPVSAAFILSFLAYGLWPLEIGKFEMFHWNLTLFPWSVLPGLVLMVMAISKRKFKLVLPVSPLLSPYLANHSWAFALLSIVDSKWIVLASLASWLLRAFWLV